MKAIIFSKNRAMQLDCLLRSMKENCNIFSRVSVLYVSDNPATYDKLITKHNNIEFIEQTDFKTDFLAMLENSHQYIGLFVDDDIIYRKVRQFEIWEAIQDDMDIISLRLGGNIKKAEHFSYKGSVDGNIFNKFILQRLKDKPFSNPNQLESKLVNIAKNYTMAWFTQSHLIGIPANKVSATSGCSDMGVEVEELDKLWMQGYEIDYKAMDLHHNNVHKNINYAYTLASSN